MKLNKSYTCTTSSTFNFLTDTCSIKQANNASVCENCLTGGDATHGGKQKQGTKDI